MDKLLAQLQAFLDGTTAVDFALAPEERYGFIGRTVRRFTYGHPKRAQKAVVLRFLERVSGYSRQQLTLSLKREGVAAIAELPGKTALNADHGIDRHLGGAPFVVSALPFSRLPFYAELVQCRS
jgi:hypothetical protein